jgi:pyruvate dehydrogenase E1 component
LAYSIPTVRAYDPAFAYELAVIIKDGIYRMYEKREDLFYYITIGNENYRMPEMPKGCEEGIIKGIYKYKVSKKRSENKAHLLGSGAIMNEVLKAQEILEKDYNISTDVWSVTSYKQLHINAKEVERWNRLNPDKKQKLSYIEEITKGEKGVFIAASDYVQILGDAISEWFPVPLISLGTYGFGRSDTRENLRHFFEVDAKNIVYSTLYSLFEEKKITQAKLKKAAKDLGIKPDKPNPMFG